MIARFEEDKIKTYSVYPKTFISNNGTNILNYRKASHRHYKDGFRDVVNVTFDSITHKRGLIYFDVENDYFTYYVVELTTQELDDRIPKTLTKIQFKTGILINHGITNDMVNEFFETLDENIIKQTLKLRWNESTIFERNDENLRKFSPYLGITLGQLDQIFIDFSDI